jgi:hypothetical protein
MPCGSDPPAFLISGCEMGKKDKSRTDSAKPTKFITPLSLVVSLCFLALSFVYMKMNMRINFGWFSYPIDDCFVNLAVAKNIVTSGTWGINSDIFAGISSSPLWTLIVSACFKIAGVHLRIPWMLNVIFSIGLILYIDAALAYYGRKRLTRNITLILVIFFAPLLTISFLGMEHVLHAALVIPFVHLASLQLDEIRNQTKASRGFVLILLAILLVATRYESLALVLPASFFFWKKKERGYSILLTVCALLPVVAYAVYSTSNGGLILPNRFFLHFLGTPFDIESILKSRILFPLIDNPGLVAISIVSFTVIYRRYHRYGIPWDKGIIASFLLSINIIAHLFISNYGQFYRHELYIYVMAFFVGSWIWIDEFPDIFRNIRGHLVSWPERLAFLLVLLLLFPVAWDLGRRPALLRKVPTSLQNVYDQQIQISRFFSRYFSSESVIVNEVGSIAFSGDVNVIDIRGPGSNEILNLKLANSFSSRDISKISKRENARVAIIYDSWFEDKGLIPEEWCLAGKWRIRNNISCAEDEVSIYSTNIHHLDYVMESLKSFSILLSHRVTQKGEYLMLVDENNTYAW